MSNLNSVLIEGVLVRNPELSYTPKGLATCKFQLSSRRSFKKDDKVEEEVSCFDVSCWGRLAEVCGDYLKRGHGVRVVGRLAQDESKQVYVLAEHIEFKPILKKAKAVSTEEVEA